jgi:hypothetical protein
LTPRCRRSSAPSPTSFCSTSTCRAAAVWRSSARWPRFRPEQRFLALSVSDAPDDVIAVIRAARAAT